MRGHEYIRDAVKEQLVAQVPVRLAVIEADLDPADRIATVDFVLDDGLFRLESLPAVVVRASDATVHRQVSPTEWLYDYTIETIVAVSIGTIGGYEAATRARDHLLRAVREALLGPAVWPDDTEPLTGRRPEKTGPGIEQVNGAPLAVGTIVTEYRVTEILDLDLTTVDGVDITVDVDPL